MVTKKLNPKVQHLQEKAMRKRVDHHIATGEKIEIQKWHDHVEKRHEIHSFTSIVDNKLYYVEPRKDETFLPFHEYHGDHADNWIICINSKTNVELFRKNIRTVDMVTWKLSSSQTNTEKS